MAPNCAMDWLTVLREDYMTTMEVSAALLERDIFPSLIDHFRKRRKTETLSAVSIMKLTALLIFSKLF